MGNAGIVVDGIQPSVTGQRLLHCGFYFVVAGHIAEDGEMVRAEFSRNSFDPLPVIGDNDHICAFSSVSLCAITADAAGATGEENDFVFKRRIHGKKQICFMSNQISPFAAASGSGN